MTYDRFASLDQVTAKGVLEAGICLLIFGTLNARMYALVSGEDITTITSWTEAKTCWKEMNFTFLSFYFLTKLYFIRRIMVNCYVGVLKYQIIQIKSGGTRCKIDTMAKKAVNVWALMFLLQNLNEIEQANMD